jgi:adenine-specific DNA-methyltransferase
LEVLKLLTSAYREQVKCIYIDPPYNTGGDFIYPDNYTKSRKEYWEENGTFQDGVKLDTNTEASGRYHSDWLSMMYSRLLIARQLLKDDGVIFVSIDDNEVHNLSKVMDDVFGEENFLQCLIWKKRSAPPNDKIVGAVHEYILAYAKDQNTTRLYRRIRGEKNLARYKNPDNHPKGKWAPDNLMANIKGGRYVASLYFPIMNPETGEEHYPSSGGNWRFNKEKIQGLLDNKEIYFGEDGKGRPKLKRFLKDVREGLPYSTIWDFVDYTTGGSREIQDILGNVNIFDTPKPTSLIIELLKMSTSEGDIVLDFFAGSGTTGHAAIKLKSELGERRFILIQLPEKIDQSHGAYKDGYKTISDITIERNKRVIEGYGDDPQPIDTGFKVYRLTKSHFPRAEFQPDPDKSNEENIELLKRYIAEKEASFHMAFEQDKVFDEVLLKNGFRLDYKLTKQEEFEKNTVYLAEERDRKAYICLDTTIANETVDFFKTHKDTMFICLERALDTTKKWNLNHNLGERLKAI